MPDKPVFTSELVDAIPGDGEWHDVVVIGEMRQVPGGLAVRDVDVSIDGATAVHFDGRRDVQDEAERV